MTNKLQYQTFAALHYIERYWSLNSNWFKRGCQSKRFNCSIIINKILDVKKKYSLSTCSHWPGVLDTSWLYYRACSINSKSAHTKDYTIIQICCLIKHKQGFNQSTCCNFRNWSWFGSYNVYLYDTRISHTYCNFDFHLLTTSVNAKYNYVKYVLS